MEKGDKNGGLKEDNEMIERKCDYCGKNIYVYKEFSREKMFCTIGCLDAEKV